MLEAYLKTLTDENLTDLALRNWERCDKVMRKSAEGGLQYGWDWRTFAIYFPTLYKRRVAILAEGRRRGLGARKTTPAA